MSDVQAPAAPLPPIPAWFVVSLALLTALLIALGILRANRSTLRGDEIVTLLMNRNNGNLFEMARIGARGQVSPAPLFYILDRIVDDSRASVDYLGLRPSGYYRLPSILFTAGLGIAAAYLIASRLRRRPEPAAYFLVLCGLAVYWFQPKLFSFASIDRPYALWNGLWLLSLALLLARPGARLALAIVLSLLATTASASCFQILAIGLALYGVRRFERKPVKEILREGAIILTVPALLSAYYALRSKSGEHGDTIITLTAAPNLLKFWLVTNLHVWIALTGCLVLMRVKPNLREFAVPVVALAVLFLIVPVIYGLAAWKGYSSPSRQYLWTTTALPLTLFLTALSWPELKSWKPAPAAAPIAAVGLVLAYSVATFFKAPERNDSRRLACLDPGSPLMQQLRHERPQFLRGAPDMNEIESKNVQLLAEWIRIRYHDLPWGNRDAPIRDVRGALVSEPILRTQDVPPGWTPYTAAY